MITFIDNSNLDGLFQDADIFKHLEDSEYKKVIEKLDTIIGQEILENDIQCAESLNTVSTKYQALI